MVALKAQVSGINANIADIDKAIIAHIDQIAKLSAQRRKLLEELQIMCMEIEESETVDIQDLIGNYRASHPSCRVSEIKAHLIDVLDKEYGIGIAASYSMIDTALSNELFRHRLKKRKPL